MAGSQHNDAHTVCKGCGASFIAKHGNGRYCSRVCRRTANHRDWLDKNGPFACKHCGKGFEPSRSDRTTYCSRGCAFKAKRAKPPVRFWSVWFHECRVCDRLYTSRGSQRGVCSTDCGNAIQRADYYLRYRTRQPDRDCRHCGASFCPVGSNSMYCSAACRKRHLRPIYKAKREARLRQCQAEAVDPFVVFARDGWRCQECKRKTPRSLRGTILPSAPELDHIVPVSLGGDHSYRNTRCLCRSCNGAKGAGPGGQLLLIGDHMA